jgi:sortase A
LGFRAFLVAVGLCAVAYYGFTLANEYIYQAYENWAFDQQIAGRTAVTFADYVREQTHVGFLVGRPDVQPQVAKSEAAANRASEVARPPEGALLGRVEITRLHLSAIVREGVDAKTLSVAVGHVPSTSLPGNPGNFAIAAHRDTLFRALKDIRIGDVVTFQSPSATFTYHVKATKVVRPSDVSVLRADGGGLISVQDSRGSSAGTDAPKLLTMITCYPFYYVGAAPNRFIVEAEQVGADSGSKLPGAAQLPPAPPSHPAAPRDAGLATPHSVRRHAVHRSHRAVRNRHRAAATQLADDRPLHASYSKKHRFWHRLLHF